MAPSQTSASTSGNRMTHSLSTPSGVDGSSLTLNRGSKKLAIRVQMLDDSITLFQVQAKALGKVLFEQVCRQLNLLEADYFGLEYQDANAASYWLDLEKPINRQVGLSLVEPMFRFCVKFYTPDPVQLEEEFTRFLLCLQIKRDLATNTLQCNDNTAALMASYIVQASCGDYAADDYPDHTYLSSYRFVPHQDATMQRKIMENHKKHVGQTPAEADLNLLETARRCELYGMKMHPAKDIEGVPLNLAVAHMGIAVFQGITRINTFSWAKIRKISFKRKRFLIKLHPEGYGYYKDTVEFFFDTRNDCKNFWKKCVENHGFFRCTTVQSTPRRKARVLSRGSSFRYSGKTQKQIVEFVRENYVKRQTFQRSQSFRQGPLQASNRSMSHTSCNVNSSISAHPLLPIETAEWDYRNQNRDSMTPSQTRRQADIQNHQRDNRTEQSRPQVTAAQVEIYTTKNTAQTAEPMDSNHSASPTATWSSRKQTTDNNAIREIDPAHGRSEDGINHGINGNVSLNRHGELSSPQHRYDLSMGSDKSSSLSRSEGGVYDVVLAESGVNQNHQENNGNVVNNDMYPMNGHTSLDSREGRDSIRKRISSSEVSYFLAREILMTERTYKKDLDILNTWFQDELPPENVEALQPLFQLIESMTHHHGVFLRDLEHRIVLWENRNMHETPQIGDIMLKNMVVLPVYEEYVEHHRECLERLNEMYESDEAFQQIYREFEQQKICYVPIGALVLRPLHRLLHYQMILEKMLEFYPEDHSSYTDCQGALVMLSRTSECIRQQLEDSENFQLLCELQRDLGGFSSLVNNNRLFIRQGCLLKHSKRGLQQRIFFLFSDVLLYGTKSPVNQQFKILGHVPVRSLMTENAEHNAFLIYGGQRVITVSAGTTAEKTLWLAELSKASTEIKSKPHVQLSLGTLNNCSSSEEGLEICGQSQGNKASASTSTNVTNVRSNNAIHVCWHRGATVGLKDFIVSSENQLSGYLLRKFKNSSGWQKLWVVFTSFCLFFYKNYQDEFALASLPLLGYSVGPPGFQDTIQKEFVFKLSFKNHVYFFRADSEHTYNRWMEVLRTTTQTQEFKNTRGLH